MKNYQKRFYYLFIVFIASAAIIFLVLFALRQNINLFYTPRQLLAGEAPKFTNIRVGGMVVNDSIKRASDSLVVEFFISDHLNKILITYDGILPDLFREGQGVVARGVWREDNIFRADQILAKHDENYMPAEVMQAMAAQELPTAESL